MLKYQISIALFVPDCVFSCCVCGEPIQAEVVSVGHTQWFQSTTQSAPRGTLRYMTSCRRSSACFEFIDNLLLTVPPAALSTPCFTDCRDAQKLLTYGSGQGPDLPSFCARTSGAPPLHGRYGQNLIAVLWILGHMVHYVIDNRGQ